jgi:acyl carrier protein
MNDDWLRADVAKVLKEVLVKRTGRQGDDWTEQTPLKDTGLDSFDAIECIFELDEHYKVDIDFNANDPEAKLETIGDLVGMVSRAIAARRKP